MNINNLTLEEKIGQKFIVGINSNDIDCLYDLIKNYKIGGVILYKKNYTSYSDLINKIKKLKQANKNNKLPLFISIDQEGGRVNRMPEEINNIRNIYDLSSLNDINIIKETADTISKLLYETGINMNFAPVLDIYNESDSKVLYKRCFSNNLETVSNYGISFMNQVKQNNVIPVVKHFPGHGASSKDSHVLLPYITNYNEVLNKHIKPFEEAIKNNCDAIMIGHLIIRKLTSGLPASLSNKFITDYLRIKYNYDRLIITDDIKMNAINILYRFNSFEKAFSSGSDLIMFKYSKGDEKWLNKIIKKAQLGLLDINEIDKSVKRIQNIKSKYKIDDNIDFKGCDIMKINSKIDKINNYYNEVKNGKK